MPFYNGGKPKHLRHKGKLKQSQNETAKPRKLCNNCDTFLGYNPWTTGGNLRPKALRKKLNSRPVSESFSFVWMSISSESNGHCWPDWHCSARTDLLWAQKPVAFAIPASSLTIFRYQYQVQPVKAGCSRDPGAREPGPRGWRMEERANGATGSGSYSASRLCSAGATKVNSALIKNLLTLFNKFKKKFNQKST